MSTTHIRYSSLYNDLIKDIESMYFVGGHNYEKKIIEVMETNLSKDSVGVIFYDKNDASQILKELKNLPSFDDSGLIWQIDIKDWNSQNLFWTQGWGSICFKMKIQQSEYHTRYHKYSINRIEKELRVDISAAPDKGMCVWGDTEDFLKRAKLTISGLNRSLHFSLEDWKPKSDTGNKESASPYTEPKCECGAHKVYGKSVNPFFHSRWCRLFVNNR